MLTLTSSDIEEASNNSRRRRSGARPERLSTRSFTDEKLLQWSVNVWPTLPESERLRYDRDERMREVCWPPGTRASITNIGIAYQFFSVDVLFCYFPYAFDAKGRPYVEYEEPLLDIPPETVRDFPRAKKMGKVDWAALGADEGIRQWLEFYSQPDQPNVVLPAPLREAETAVIAPAGRHANAARREPA